MFYRFSQNNSGGYFDGYHNVIVEATGPAQANEFAVASGYVYFGDRGDCVSCCGYRWNEMWETDTYEDGYRVIEDAEEAMRVARGGYFTSTGDNIIIYADGREEIF